MGRQWATRQGSEVSGVCLFTLGIIVLLQWPNIPSSVLGFLVGLNILSAGVSLLLVSRALASNIQE
jgi:uncharacterized membrane protein HdeD (DUF308 family)